MSYILNIESQFIKDYKTSKYKYKKIKNAIDELLLGHDFFENHKINLKISVITKDQIIILISFPLYNINKKIIVNKEKFKLKNIDNKEVNIKEFLEEINKKEFERFNLLVPESNVDFDIFFKNKSHYKNILAMSIY